MHRSTTILLTGLLLVCAGQVRAQITLRNTTIGKALIVSDDAPAGPEEAKIGVNIFDLQASFPLVVRQDRETRSFAVLENTIGFRGQKFTYDWPAGDTEYKPDAVYGISYGLNLIRSHGPQWRSIAFGTLGLHSDLEDPGSDDLFGEGGVLLVRQVGEHWQLGAGPVITHAFGNLQLIPAPYVRYQGAGRYLVDVRIPQYAIVGYQLSERVQAAVALRSVFNNYNLGDPQAQDIDGEKSSIVFSDFTLGVESRISLGGALTLEVGAATTLDRTLEVNDHSGDKVLDRGLEDSWMVSIGLSFGPQ
jgi:hypothetical protein